MLHTKFQGHQSISSDTEDFKRFLPYMGHSDHIDHVTWTVSIKFSSPQRKEALHEILLQLALWFVWIGLKLS